jgi:hypothetical protein
VVLQQRYLLQTVELDELRRAWKETREICTKGKREKKVKPRRLVSYHL